MKMMKLWMLVVVATIASACSKQDDAGFEGAATKTVQFVANEVGGRTIFGTPEEGTYPVLWQEDDQVSVTLNLNTRKAATITPVNEGQSASFAINYVENEDATQTFYAIAPASQLTGTYDMTNSNPRIIVRVPAEQTPSAVSCDPLAQILYAQSETYTTIPEQVALSFKHWCAYGCLTIKNLNTTEAISEVQLVIDGYLAGSTYWRPTQAAEADQFYAVGSTAPSNTITLNTSSVENPLWFAALPVDLSGKDMTIRVVLENGDVIKKNITFKNGDGNFQAGRIAKFSVNFDGLTIDEGFNVGDVYPKTGTPEGVVFWVADDGASAKIVSLEYLTAQAWMEMPDDVAAYPNVGGLSGSAPSGIENTNAIKADAAEKGYEIPMLTFLEGLGSDWYWPTTSDYEEIHNQLTTVNATLTEQNATTLSGIYWTSRQNAAGTNAYYWNFDTGGNSNKTKANSYSGRAVKIVM